MNPMGGRPCAKSARQVHTAQVPCEFEELLSKIDRKTGKESEAHSLDLGRW